MIKRCVMAVVVFGACDYGDNIAPPDVAPDALPGVDVPCATFVPPAWGLADPPALCSFDIGDLQVIASMTGAPFVVGTGPAERPPGSDAWQAPAQRWSGDRSMRGVALFLRDRQADGFHCSWRRCL